MRLSDSIIITADAAAVWPFVADPVLWADWNEKVVSIGRDRSGPVRFGERFELIGRVAGRERQCTVEATIVDLPNRVVFVLRSIWRDRPQLIEESYVLDACGDIVKVIRSIDLSRGGVPFWLRLLFWVFHRFGTPVGPVPLAGLKMLVESHTAAA